MSDIFIGDIRAEADAWHPDKSEDFFQLWDFYGIFEEGYTCIAQFYYRPWYPFCEYRVEDVSLPITLLSIVTPDGVLHTQRRSYPASSFKGSTEKLDVTIGDSKATGKYSVNGLPEEFHIEIAQSEVSADLTYHVQIGGMRNTGREDGYTYYNPVSKEYFGYCVVTARSEITGTLTVNGRTARVHGLGFHNNNWGTIKLTKIQSKWLFTMIYADDYTIYYLDAAAAKAYGYRHFSPFVLWKGKKVVLSTFNAAAYIEKFSIDPVTKGPYPKEETFRAFDRDMEVTGLLPSGIIVENSKAIDLPGFPFTRDNPGFHFFQVSDAEFEIGQGGQREKLRGRAFREFLLLDELFPCQTSWNSPVDS